MTQYQKPILHNSHDMMQELFEEINNYLGVDQGETTLDSSPPLPLSIPDLSPFHLSKDKEDDSFIDQVEHETHLQSGMLVKSGRNLNDSNHFQHDHNDETTNFTDYYRHLTHLDNCNNNDDARVNTNEPPSTTKRPIIRRPKSSMSFGATNRSKLAHIAGLVKQTFTSTTSSSTDALPANSTVKQQQAKRPSFISFTTSSDKHNSASSTSQSTLATTAAAGIDIRDQSGPQTPPTLAHYYAYSHNKINSADLHNRSPRDFEYSADDQGALCNGVQHVSSNSFWMPTTTTAVAAGMQAISSGVNDMDVSSDLNLGEVKQVDSFDALLSYEDPYPGEKQQALDGSLPPNQLPFLTPMNRTGEPHTVTLRTKMARDVGTHEDRINAYNNAYCHCIMAKSDIVPWIKKQYYKGPPDLIYTDYMPRHRKSSSCILDLFKRQPKPTTPTLPPSASKQTVTLHSDSVSSTRSSISIEPTIAAYQQMTSSIYGMEQQLSTYKQNSDMALGTQLISEEETYSSEYRTDTPGSVIDDGGGLQQQNPQDCYQQLNRKKKSTSLASLEEMVPPSILKEESISSSPASFTDPTLLSKKSSGFGLQNKSSLSSLIEDQPRPYPSPSLKYERSNDINRPPLVSRTSTNLNSSNHGDHFSAYPPPPPDDWLMPSSRHQQNRSISPSLSTTYHNRSTSPMAPPPQVRRYSSPFTDPSTEIANRPHHHRHYSPAGSHQNSSSFALPLPSSSRYHSLNQQPPAHHSNSHRHISHIPSPPSSGIYDGGRRMTRIRSNEHISMSPSSSKKMNRRRSFSQLVPTPPPPPSNDYMLPPSKPPHRPRRLSKAPSHSSLGADYYGTSGIPTKYYTPHHHAIMDNNKRHRRRWSMATNDDGLYYDYFPTTNRPRSKQQQNHRYNQEAAALDNLCEFFHHLPRYVLFNYLKDAQGDFYLAKDMCMEDILAAGI